MELTDYARRFLVDQPVDRAGRRPVTISGERRFAMRVWMDRQALAARALTVDDIEQRSSGRTWRCPADGIEFRSAS